MPVRERTIRPRRGVLVACMMLVLAFARPAAAQNDWRHEAREWSLAATVLGGTFLLDQEIRSVVFVHADSVIPGITRFSDPLGRPYTYAPVLAVLYGTGVATGNDGLARGALNGAGALAAAEMGTRLIKFVVGRGRPDTPGADGDEFRFFTVDPRWSSFPSGHATTAFAMATVVAHEIHNPWASGAAYGAASVVAWGRIRENRHWSSDVVGGALAGMFFSEVMLRWTDEHGHDVSPADGRGVPVVLQFAIPVR